MTDLLGAVFLAIAFAAIVHALGLVRHATMAVTLSGDAMKVMSDSALSDDEKERIMQAQSLKLFRLFGILLLGGSAALLVPLAAVWAFALFGFLSFEGVMHAAMSWSFIIAATAIAIASFWIGGLVRRASRE